ncbi:mitochondrial Rho GTPase 2 isoform X2 [Prosopis cineraria]|uniref:mitochondrial Rho GTPase 2 isoform X2 n=1 Tax=Prosopis cineraria TaxID=364024 RepID=UPI00240F63C5|nr:mitochondrial Rho GTPase 2 isoform X2 [Prosopis cineraria]
MAVHSSFAGRSGVRVAVIGDRGTGKSSLIAAAASESFPDAVPLVLPPTLLPDDWFPDHVPLTIIDTSSSLEKRGKRNDELKRADVVILTYACDEPTTITRLSTYWIPELEELEVRAPVIVVGCKLDLQDENQQINLENLMTQLLQQYSEIVTCIECSAATLYQVPEVFYFAQKAVLHPVDPLFDHERQALTDRCLRALRRIFVLCDRDMDGALNDAELNGFQVRCFDTPLQSAEIMEVRTLIQQQAPEGINRHGLTFAGFTYIHNTFLKKGRPETIWAVLRKFGYNNDLKLRDDFLPVPSNYASDQRVELTNEAVEFLNGIFRLLDTDRDRAVQPAELDKLFSTAPESPWSDDPYKDAVERTDAGYMTLSGFLSQWAFMTLLDPPSSLANLIYIGYSGNPAAALRVTRKRSVDRKKQKTGRNVFQCYVFGSKNAGKSTLLHSFLRRPFSDTYTPTMVEQYAANIVELIGGTRKTLILREIPEDKVKKFLPNRDCLAACDVAVFVYDSSDEHSWKRTRELLEEVSRQGELTGHRVPCLLIAAKDDLTPYPRAVQDSVKVTEELGIEAPIHVSLKLGDSSNVYDKIVSAAERPHLNIPETDIGRKRRLYHQLLHHTLVFASVGAAMAVVGLAAFRGYAMKKNSA